MITIGGLKSSLKTGVEISRLYGRMCIIRCLGGGYRRSPSLDVA